MTNLEQERWSRVKGRLKAEVGEDIFSSWFARMDLEALEKDTARLSVPTRFLKTWIQSHYGDRVLRCWQAEERGVQRIDTHGSLGGHQDARGQAARRRAGRSPARASRREGQRRRDARRDVGCRAGIGCARSIGRLAARSAADLRHLRARTLQHADACGRQAGCSGAARRPRDVQSALHPCRCGPWQNASAAGDHLGRQRQWRPQGALSHRRALHVRLRLGAARTRMRSPTRKLCAASTCW